MTGTLPLSPPAAKRANWASPDPASDVELERHALPCDVAIGDVVFRKGTGLHLLVEHHRALHDRVYQGKDFA